MIGVDGKYVLARANDFDVVGYRKFRPAEDDSQRVARACFGLKCGLVEGDYVSVGIAAGEDIVCDGGVCICGFESLAQSNRAIAGDNVGKAGNNVLRAGKQKTRFELFEDRSPGRGGLVAEFNEKPPMAGKFQS